MSSTGPSDWWSVSPMDLVLLGLATWRLTSLLIQEDGPWDFLARFRHWLGVRYDERSLPYGLNTLAALFTCMWCGSVWTGGVLAVAYWVLPSLTLMVCLPLALSAIGLLLNRMVPHE